MDTKKSRTSPAGFTGFTPSSHHSHVGSVGFRGGDASVFHDPLVPSPLLPSVTAVVAETPGAVDEHLLRQNLQGAGLKGIRQKKWDQ